MIHIKFNGDIVKRSYSFDGETLTGTTITHACLSSGHYPLAIHKLEFETERYRIYYRNTASAVTLHRIYYKDWDVPTNTVSSEVQIYQYTGGKSLNIDNPRSVSINGELFVLFFARTLPGKNQFFGWINPDVWDYVLVRISLETSAILYNDVIHSVTTPAIPGSSPTQYEHFFVRSYGSGVYPFGIFQDGDAHIKIILWYSYGNEDFNIAHERLVICNETGVQSDTQIYSGTSDRFSTLIASSIINTQLTKTYGIIGSVPGGANLGFVTNGSVFITFTGTEPYYLNDTTIYPVYSRSQPYYIALNGSTFVACDAATLSPIINISTAPDYTFRHPWSMPTTYSDEIFWYGWLNATGEEYLIKTSSILEASSIITFKLDFNGSTAARGFNIGGWFIHGLSTVSTTAVTYYYFIGGELEFPSYKVLQREGSDFHLIQQDSKPIRIDISNNSPILSVQDNEDTFQSNFVYGNELTQVIPISGLDSSRQVRDYRYTLLETTSGVVVASGGGVNSQILYVSGSGIYTSDINTYSGGFVLWQEIPSGSAERIETSNYTYPGQFIFVTTSGDDQTFYQKNNDSPVFVEYSGIPSSRITRIRLDDRF